MYYLERGSRRGAGALLLRLLGLVDTVIHLRSQFTRVSLQQIRYLHVGEVLSDWFGVFGRFFLYLSGDTLLGLRQLHMTRRTSNSPE